MLDPRDREFLTAAVARGALTEARARELAARYRGLPGGLAAALVELGVLTPQARLALEAALAPPVTPPRPGAGRLVGPAADDAPTRLDDHVLPLGGPPSPAAADAASSLEGLTPSPPQRPPPAAGPAAAPGPPPTPVDTPSTGRLHLPGGGPPRVPGYEVEAELGRGGMGVVYRARRLSDGRVVALKVLLDVSERHQARFRREASALKRLEHPGIVELLETGEVDGQPFIAMAYLPGGDFRVAMSRGLLDGPRALRVVARAARAIAYAHAQNVVHRDLKPANILLDADLEPKVSDFGLARILDHESQLTRTGVAVGTPQFMAPEQVRATDPTPACDVFALGAILYVVATRELPFKGSGAALLTAICNDAPRPPWEVERGVPRALGDLILACLEKDPAARPTCLALADALDAHLDGRPIRIVPASRVRRRRLAALGVAAAVGLGLAVGLGVSAWRRSDRAAAEAALEGLRAALAEARRARGKLDRTGYEREAAALRSAAAALAAVPPGGAEEARATWARAGADERRAEVLAALVPLHLDAADVAAATSAARERAEVTPDALGDVLLARCLARDPRTALEACRLALRGARAAGAGAGPQAEGVARDGAEALLGLARPALAAEALAGAPEALRPLRARARLLAGDLDGAQGDLVACVASAARDRALVAALAEVEVRRGHPREALARLDALRDGGGDAGTLAARAMALEATGRPAAARAAWADALGLDPARRASRARLHLRRGRPALALADLRGDAAPAARLDAGVAAWLDGADDDATLAALADVAEAARRHAATPAVGAAAEAWAARVELARGRAGPALVRAVAAWALDPSPASAAVLGLARLRADDAQGALAAVAGARGATPEGEGVAALALVALGQPDAAAARAAPGAWGADVARLVALRRGRADEAAEAERAAWRLRAVTRLGDAGGARACPVPVASDPGPTPTLEAAARLAWAARVAAATWRDASGQARVRRLLERAAALDPDHVPARAELLTLTRDLAGLRRLIEARPSVVDLRRARLLLLLAGGEDPPLAEVEADAPALAAARELSARERLALARTLAKGGRADAAWSTLAPLLEAADRDPADDPLGASLACDPEAFALGATLAEARGDADRAKALEKVRRSVERTRERAEQVRAAAVVTETVLKEATEALDRWARGLPLDEDYWWKRAHALSGSTRVSWSTMAGAEYVLVARGLWAYKPTYWTFAYGYSRVATANETPLELAGRATERDPRDPGPFLARAMYLLARVHNAAPEASPEDLEAAADAALHAAALAPGSPGALALAADALCELRDGPEAEPLAAAALLVDPQCQYATHQLARCAALRGDAAAVAALLRAIERPDRYDVAGYQFRKDPCFQGPIAEDPEVRRLIGN